ncbi:hypothetical protein [Paraburkholderia sp. GAS348]|uniref:hypothetical protein n=1 Tax=Paraburkholderia sp. GAS348 TaxID=3035132 RepID=UPI003D1F3AD8
MTHSYHMHRYGASPAIQCSSQLKAGEIAEEVMRCNGVWAITQKKQSKISRRFIAYKT